MLRSAGLSTSSIGRKHARRGQQLRAPSMVQAESIKEQQQKAREELEAKRARLDGRHNYLFSTIADKLAIEVEQIENFMLEGDQLEVIEKFFKADGSVVLMFFYQPPTVGDDSNKTVSSGGKLWISDGTTDAYTGVCLFFLRSNLQRAITNVNIHQEVNFGMLESNGEGLLGALEQLLEMVFIPALSRQEKWGEITGPDMYTLRSQFISKLSSFVGVLSNARASLADVVQLAPCEGINIQEVSYQLTTAAANPAILEAAEKCAGRWCAQIEQILTESEQMRKEADTVGPRAELDHWKKRVAKFDSLTSCIKSSECRTVIALLVAAKSRLLKQWRRIDTRITDCTNEAKDNVKFLYTLEKYVEPLYKSNPVSMLESIPGLMNAIRMINSYSRYYNTSERMTALFVKVTNQMITSCRSYITDSGYHNIWEQERDAVLKKIEACLTLNREYQQCFQHTKARLANLPNERPFDFSEMYMFGKFNNFCNRLEKIKSLLVTMDTFSTLGLSHIEGIDTFNARFNVMIAALKKKPYDILDQRRTDFDGDYDDFLRQLSDLQDQLQAFMDEKFVTITTTQPALHMLLRFQRLHIPKLNIEGRFHQIILMYTADLELVQKMYMKDRRDPPLPRDLPPISGRIAWARQLYRRISSPMDVFQQFDALLKSPDAIKVVKGYNRMARVLVEYEVLHHQAWTQRLEAAMETVKVTLLVRHPDNKEKLLVNFDPAILEIFREVQYLSSIGLEVPPSAQNFCFKKNMLKETYQAVEHMVHENERIRQRYQSYYNTY